MIQCLKKACFCAAFPFVFPSSGEEKYVEKNSEVVNKKKHQTWALQRVLFYLTSLLLLWGVARQKDGS